MQINIIQPYSFNSNKKPSFGGWERVVYKQTSNVFAEELNHRNNTYIFRDGHIIPSIVDFMVFRYMDTPKVNTYVYGCSNGSEPYSVLMSMISRYGEEMGQKFTKIKAFDYDSEAIIKAKSKYLPISIEEFEKICDYTLGKFNKFFDGESIGISKDFNRYLNKDTVFNVFGESKRFEDSIIIGKEVRLRDKYADMIEYSVANILDDYKNIEPDNSVVFARNFWPYLTTNERSKLAKNLGNQLNDTSMLVLGNFDMNSVAGITNLLGKNGFIRTGKTEPIFEKIIGWTA